jgi:hypothetical protein
LILLDAEDAGAGAMDISGMTELDLEGYDEGIDVRKKKPWDFKRAKVTK